MQTRIFARCPSKVWGFSHDGMDIKFWRDWREAWFEVQLRRVHGGLLFRRQLNDEHDSHRGVMLLLPEEQ